MLFDLRVPRLFTIPAHASFVDGLADGLLAWAAEDPIALSSMEILVPTRRSVTSLREAFLRRSNGTALLLPRIQPVGDAPEEDLAFDAPGTGLLDMPPVIGEIQRRLTLARFILNGGQAERPGEAVRLADALGQLIDSLAEHDISPDALMTLVPDAYAAHWQETLTFLEVVLKAWPDYLNKMQAMDPGAHHRRLMLVRSDALMRNPPDHPVIVAGSTGSVPATATLMAAVASLPQGAVVLPGLDRNMDIASWKAAAEEPAHPQHVMARLLKGLGVSPANVADWPGLHAPDRKETRRTSLIQEIMRPASTSDRWRALPEIASDDLDGIRWIDCPGIEEEAAVIALMLREAADWPGKRAALVTPDRDLARRVAAQLTRWEIHIDDSAGMPLGRTPPGTFLRLLAECAAHGFGPIPLLSLLKHPLAAGGKSVVRFRDDARLLDREVLRGPRPTAGLDGLLCAIRHRANHPTRPLPALTPIAEDLERLFRELDYLCRQPSVSAGALLDKHVQTLEALADSDAATGGSRLWVREDGEALAELIADLAPAFDALAPMDPADFPDLLQSFLDQRPVRPRYGQHPRLFIWGPLEARLQQVERIVLGGLNEASWPPEAETDPWMSRPMRATLGLPSPERRIGQSAHDFAQAFATPEVILTRSLKVAGTPTVPSRWLTRLAAVLGPMASTIKDTRPVSWAAALDRATARIEVPRPNPAPPLEARPRRYTVSDIETLITDPYRIFAKRILGLVPLDPIDEEPGAAVRGSIVHDALKAFIAAHPDELPAEALADLLSFGDKEMAAFADRPNVAAFWKPRFHRIAHFVLATEQERRAGIAALHAEVTGEMPLSVEGIAATLAGRADRIERRHDGTAWIVDYKTGAPPNAKAVRSGARPQLTLEALIAETDGFTDKNSNGLGLGTVGGLEYWHLKGTEPAGEVKTVAAGDLSDLLETTRQGLTYLLTYYLANADAGYLAFPPESGKPDYNPYGHLARAAEWGRGTGEGEE